jgi:hypothetical protein
LNARLPGSVALVAAAVLAVTAGAAAGATGARREVRLPDRRGLSPAGGVRVISRDWFLGAAPERTYSICYVNT